MSRPVAVELDGLVGREARVSVSGDDDGLLDPVGVELSVAGSTVGDTPAATRSGCETRTQPAPRTTSLTAPAPASASCCCWGVAATTVAEPAQATIAAPEAQGTAAANANASARLTG